MHNRVSTESCHMLSASKPMPANMTSEPLSESTKWATQEQACPSQAAICTSRSSSERPVGVCAHGTAIVAGQVGRIAFGARPQLQHTRTGTVQQSVD